jgi:hypothetical protein
MRYLSDTKSSNATMVVGHKSLATPHRRLLNFAFVFVLFQLAFLIWLPGGMAASIQSQIIEEALGNQFCKDNLNLILWGCDSGVDATGNESGPSYRHFLDPDLVKSVNYIEREKLKILNLCITADTDQSSRALALYHMGLLFHTVQEFYARSNYIELKLAGFEKAKHVPSKDELYGLELVDWSQLNMILHGGGKSNLTVSQLNKIDSNSDESKKTFAGVTYFAIAKELSVRETERQWHQLSSLIKARMAKNGPQILVALTNAGVPDEVIAEIKKEQESALK